MRHYKKWDTLEEVIIRLSLDIYRPRRRVVLRTLAGLQTLEQMKGTAGTVIRRTHSKTASLPGNKSLQAAWSMLTVTQKILRSPLGWTKRRISGALAEYKIKIKRESPRHIGKNVIPDLLIVIQAQEKRSSPHTAAYFQKEYRMGISKILKEETMRWKGLEETWRKWVGPKSRKRK